MPRPSFTFAPAVVALFALAGGCSSSTIPRPPSGPSVREAGVVVPYPPPAGRVEVIPPQPRVEEVWVSGQWEWTGETWNWSEGSWRVPPRGAHFTPWSARRLRDGQLVFRSAAWRSRDGRRIADPFGEAKCPPLAETVVQ